MVRALGGENKFCARRVYWPRPRLEGQNINVRLSPSSPLRLFRHAVLPLCSGRPPSLLWPPLLPSPHDFLVSMGRPHWGTDEQVAFLETFVPGLDLAKVTCTLKVEYERISMEFMKKWPTKPSAEEMASEKDPQKLQVLIDNRRRSVSPLCLWFLGDMCSSIFPADTRVVQNPPQNRDAAPAQRNP